MTLLGRPKCLPTHSRLLAACCAGRQRVNQSPLLLSSAHRSPREGQIWRAFWPHRNIAHRPDKRLRRTTVEDPFKSIAPRPLSPLPAEVQIRLKNEHPADVMESMRSREDAGVDVLRLCLTAYHEQLYKIDRPSRRSAAADKPIAAYALSFLWKKEDRWMELVLFNY
jgi:hypothetical protein